MSMFTEVNKLGADGKTSVAALRSCYGDSFQLSHFGPVSTEISNPFQYRLGVAWRKRGTEKFPGDGWDVTLIDQMGGFKGIQQEVPVDQIQSIPTARYLIPLVPHPALRLNTGIGGETGSITSLRKASGSEGSIA